MQYMPEKSDPFYDDSFDKMQDELAKKLQIELHETRDRLNKLIPLMHLLHTYEGNVTNLEALIQSGVRRPYVSLSARVIPEETKELGRVYGGWFSLNVYDEYGQNYQDRWSLSELELLQQLFLGE